VQYAVETTAPFPPFIPYDYTTIRKSRSGTGETADLGPSPVNNSGMTIFRRFGSARPPGWSRALPGAGACRPAPADEPAGGCCLLRCLARARARLQIGSGSSSTCEVGSSLESRLRTPCRAWLALLVSTAAAGIDWVIRDARASEPHDRALHACSDRGGTRRRCARRPATRCSRGLSPEIRRRGLLGLYGPDGEAVCAGSLTAQLPLCPSRASCYRAALLEISAFLPQRPCLTPGFRLCSVLPDSAYTVRPPPGIPRSPIACR